MKIAFVYDAVYPFVKGGGEKRIYEVARRLSHKGHEVHILGMKHWAGPNSFQDNGLHYHALGKAVALYHRSGRRSILQALRFGVQACRLLVTQRFDVIDCGQWPYFHLIPGKATAFVRSSRFVVTWYEVWGRHWFEYLGTLGYAGLLVERTFCHLPDKLIAVSELTRSDLIASGVRRDSVEVIPNGIDYGRIRSVGAGPVNTHVAYCGRLKNHKNVDVLVQAVALLKKVMAKIRVVIIGGGPEEQRLRQLVRDLRLADNIVFTGAVENFDQVVQWMKSSLLFVNPSTKEGGGSITLFEANACGLPVIAVRCENGIDPSLIRERENGYFVDQLSPEVIANKVFELLSDLPLLRRNAEASIQMAAEYDWDVIASSYEQLYERLYTERQTRGELCDK